MLRQKIILPIISQSKSGGDSSAQIAAAICAELSPPDFDWEIIGKIIFCLNIPAI
jgi:hypothetical protein